MTMTGLYLFLHVLGIILWIGLAIALPFVTARAARHASPDVTAFAYRISDRLMKTLGLAGMVLTLIGGIGLTVVMDYAFFRPFPNHWLFQMQLLGFLVFAAAAFYQVPLGGRLAREAERSVDLGQATEEFDRYRKRYAIVGSVNGLVLLVIVVLGTMKP